MPMPRPTPSATVTGVANSHTAHAALMGEIYALDRARLLAELATSPQGPTTAEAARRLADYGANETVSIPRLGSLKRWLLRRHQS